jgi:hypothetical protein
MAYGWRVIPNFPLYEIHPTGRVKQILDGRLLKTSQNNQGEHYHLEGQSGRVVAIKKSMLISWAFPKDD